MGIHLSEMVFFPGRIQSMDLGSLISKNTSKVSLEGQDREEVLAELVELQIRAGKVKDRDGILEALSEREAKGSTGIGGGVAIPHAKHPEVNGITVGIGVSHQGIEFDAADGGLVYIVFLVLAGLQNPGLNVEVLADVANLMHVPGVYEQIVSAANVSALLDVVQKILV
jgi:mannitol/fructose-specific phosphotransferase system IIA component (Ntr-type)